MFLLDLGCWGSCPWLRPNHIAESLLKGSPAQPPCVDCPPLNERVRNMQSNLPCFLSQTAVQGSGRGMGRCRRCSFGQWQCYLEGWDWEECLPRSEPEQYYNDRGITLRSLAGKVYSRIMKSSIWPILNPWIQEEQCEFSPDGSLPKQFPFALKGGGSGVWG